MGGGFEVLFFQLSTVLSQPREKKVYSLMSMSFVFQEKCCGYFVIFLSVFRSPTL